MALPGIAVAAAQALFPLIVDLFRARGTKVSERNAEIIEAAAPAIMEVARAVVPGANDQEVAETILGDKILQQTFRAQAAMKWSDIEPFLRFEEDSRAKARSFTSDMMTTGPEWKQMGAGLLIGALSLFIIVGGGFLFWDMMYNPNLDPGQKGLILGALIAAFTTAVGFWFGSSASGRQSGQTVSEIAKRQP